MILISQAARYSFALPHQASFALNSTPCFQGSRVYVYVHAQAHTIYTYVCIHFFHKYVHALCIFIRVWVCVQGQMYVHPCEYWCTCVCVHVLCVCVQPGVLAMYLCPCLYVCLYILWMCICACVCMNCFVVCICAYIHVYACTYPCMCICMYPCLCLYMCVPTYVYVYVGICVPMCVIVYILVCLHGQAFMTVPSTSTQAWGLSSTGDYCSTGKALHCPAAPSCFSHSCRQVLPC